MVEGKWFAPKEDCPEGFAIRQAVFQHGRDPLDEESWNVVVYQDDTPAATGRLWWQDDSFQLGSICVLPPWRGKKLGDLVLRLLLYKAETHHARFLRLVSPADVTPFFARLGFLIEGSDEGDVISMSMRGEDLCLDACASCKKDCPNRQE